MDDRKQQQLERALEMKEFLSGILDNDRNVARSGRMRERLEEAIENAEKVIRILSTGEEL